MLTTNHRTIVPTSNEVGKPLKGVRVLKHTPFGSTLHHCNRSQLVNNKSFPHSRYNRFDNTRWNSSSSPPRSSLFVLHEGQGRVE